jgi:hypothetical protein
VVGSDDGPIAQVSLCYMYSELSVGVYGKEKKNRKSICLFYFIYLFIYLFYLFIYLFIFSSGIYGGMRAAMQLRCLLSELGTLSVSNIFGIPEVHKSIDENGKALNDHMVSGLNRMIAQLDWHAQSMKNHRDKFGVPK